MFSSRSSTEEESDSRLIHSFWQNPVHQAEVLAFLLLTRSCSQLLNAAHIPSPSDLTCLQSQQWRTAFTSNLLLFASPQELLGLFLRSHLKKVWWWHIHHNPPFLKSPDQRPWFCFSLSWLFNAWYKFIWVWEQIGIYKLSLQAICLCRIKWFRSVVSDACLVLQKWDNS